MPFSPSKNDAKIRFLGWNHQTKHPFDLGTYRDLWQKSMHDPWNQRSYRLGLWQVGNALRWINPASEFGWRLVVWVYREKLLLTTWAHLRTTKWMIIIFLVYSQSSTHRACLGYQNYKSAVYSYFYFIKEMRINFNQVFYFATLTSLEPSLEQEQPICHHNHWPQAFLRVDSRWILNLYLRLQLCELIHNLRSSCSCFFAVKVWDKDNIDLTQLIVCSNGLLIFKLCKSKCRDGQSYLSRRHAILR